MYLKSELRHLWQCHQLRQGKGRQPPQNRRRRKRVAGAQPASPLTNPRIYGILMITNRIVKHAQELIFVLCIPTKLKGICQDLTF